MGRGSTGVNDDRLAEPWFNRRRRRVLRVAAVTVLAAAVTLAGTFRNSLFHGNFGVVDRGRVYRSAQPEDNLNRLVRERRIASILNLRGGSPDDSFYANEVAVAKSQGIDFYDFPMSATQRPSRRELLVLLDLFGRCRYPLLIHCKSGSDRTGLASALYLMDRAGVAPRDALGSFSLYYGHVPLLGTRRLHEPFDEYDAWLKARNLEHTPDRLRSWVERDYRSDDSAAGILPLPEGPRAWHARRAAR
jgi:protein tyrosine phosphatase (PTP) superfamily phosphohydrolase (DUF442 family)